MSECLAFTASQAKNGMAMMGAGDGGPFHAAGFQQCLLFEDQVGG